MFSRLFFWASLSSLLFTSARWCRTWQWFLLRSPPNCVNLVWKDWLSHYLLFLSFWKMVRTFNPIFLKDGSLPTLLLLSRKCSSSCSASGSGDNEERSRIGGRLLLPGCSWSISCSPLLTVKGSPVRYTKFESIRYFIDIDILQNCLIDIDIFQNHHIDIDIDIDIFEIA